MGIIIVGAAIFCFGLTGLKYPSGDFYLSFFCALAGLSVALRGTAELTAHFVTRNLEKSSVANSINKD